MCIRDSPCPSASKCGRQRQHTRISRALGEAQDPIHREQAKLGKGQQGRPTGQDGHVATRPVVPT
eukprot:1769502-Alexandrium_andersonii.AAC.1